MSGRVDASSSWNEIGSGDLPWRDVTIGRNSRGLDIAQSTYDSGDLRRVFTEVDLSSNSNIYMEYKVQFPELRGGSAATTVVAAEIELPGWVFHPDPTSSPTKSPVAAAPEGGTPINTILVKNTSTFSEPFGGCSTSANRAIDATTEKYACSKTGGNQGFTVTPAGTQMSLDKSFRVYSGNNCVWCDPVAYILEGRVDTGSPWNEIGSGEFPWKNLSTGRNSRGLDIVSTIDSGDDRRVFTEVSFPSNSNPYMEYRVSFTETRLSTKTLVQISEIELPGFLY